jgi:hypothetical protein
MTLEAIDNRQNDTMMMLCQEVPETVPSLKLRVQPWLKLAIALICLTQGLRLLNFSDPIASLLGLGLLSSIPSCLILGLRDYRRLNPAPSRQSSGLPKAA